MLNEFARHRAAFLLLVPAIALAALPFGGMTPWFDSAFAVGAGLILALWVLGGTAPVACPLPREIAIAAGLWAAVAIWCGLQIWLPVGFGSAAPVWNEARQLLGDTNGGTLAVNPEAGARGLLRLGGYAAIFFLCFRFSARADRARILLWTVALATTVSAIYGLVTWTLGLRTVLWYERTFETGNLSATFPNRNAFADYAALGLIAVLALIVDRAERPEPVGRRTWLWTVAIFFKYVIGRSWILVYAALALFTALLLTHSRAGLVAALFGCGVFFCCALRGRSSVRTAALGAALTVAVAGFLVWAAGGGLSDRLTKLPDASVERFTIYELTLGMIAERPLLGTGLGSFVDLFPSVRPPEIRARIDYAHNSYIENALEMGLPAALAFYAGILLVGSIFVRAQLRRTASQPWAAIGISALSLAGLHAFFDYSTQFPAVAITLAALLGTAAARCAVPAAGR